ncbi:MAG: hypothetical protein ABR497_05135 [Kiritimatiellia bacterium]|nr:hypothetical protein [Lentisphaerota bacterium]
MTLNYVQQADDKVKINNVLISVWDKTGLDQFAGALVELNPALKIFSTGGTFQFLRAALGPKRSCHNLAQVSEYTGQPEMQGGLVKTLDFKIYLGLLSETYNTEHVRDLQRAQAQVIDMVVVNLYPFVQVTARAGTTAEQARANIDIGGPCMIRAAAKNFLRVACVTAAADYARILDEMRGNAGCLEMRTRLDLAGRAFAHTADYDRHIADYWAHCRPDAVLDNYRLQN